MCAYWSFYFVEVFNKPKPILFKFVGKNVGKWAKTWANIEHTAFPQFPLVRYSEACVKYTHGYATHSRRKCQAV